MDFLYSVVFSLCGLMFICMGIHKIRKIICCKTEVRAVFVRNTVFRYKGTNRYSPVFKYDFEAAEIQKETFQRFEKKKLPQFIPGKIYTIFVDEKKPESFAVINKPSVYDILLIAIMFIIGITPLVLLCFFDISILI